VKATFVAAAAACAFMAGGFAADAKPTSVSGCARQGINPFCVYLKSGGKTYNITGAVPRPKAGTYGRVTGTITTKMTACMQGVYLSPAKWRVDPTMACTQKD
jgi:hypothetical protein